MSSIVKAINKFFRTAVKKDIDALNEELLLSDRQKEIFERFYIRKQDINFIADTLGVCSLVVSNELKIIRAKMVKVLNLEK